MALNTKLEPAGGTPTREMQKLPGADDRDRVLVVDDNADAAEALQLLLTQDGYDVAVAHGGVDALHTAGRFRPHLAILDLSMPDMSGYELAEKLKAHASSSQTALVALTGFGTEQDRLRAKEAGFTRLLLKPLSYVTIAETVGDVLRHMPRAA
ncbi:MAG: hybrid sensor histidine kinase/response regulator [Rhizobacter sp.]|nr:hybrid sensor histidine kinase/response regulator [Rhizobacter sp.]